MTTTADTVLVTGATGTIGSTVVRELRRRGTATRAFRAPPADREVVTGSARSIRTVKFSTYCNGSPERTSAG